jgi:cytochrome P450
MPPWKGNFGGKSSGSRRSRPFHERHGFFYALAQEANGCEGQSYCKSLFREAPKYNLQPAELASLATNLLGAGADTSSSTFPTAVMAMRVFLGIMKPAWEELDRVVLAETVVLNLAMIYHTCALS